MDAALVSSYHSPDEPLADSLKAAIESKDAVHRCFLLPEPARRRLLVGPAGQEIGDPTTFVLLIGEAGIGKWQVPEYDEALDKWVKSNGDFRSLWWCCRRPDRAGAAVPAPAALDRHADTRVREGRRPLVRCRVRRRQQSRRSCGATRRPIAASRPWRKRTAIIFSAASARPWRCLSALAAAQDRLPVLIGNSGVGKSSLAQAGVLAALKRHGMARGGAGAECVAGGLSGQPPVVLSRCSSPVPIRSRHWSAHSSTLGSSARPIRSG